MTGRICDWLQGCEFVHQTGRRAEFKRFVRCAGFVSFAHSREYAVPGTTIDSRNVVCDAPTIRKEDRAESYSVYTTQDKPRIMLREDMPGELVSVLVAMEE